MLLSINTSTVQFSIALMEDNGVLRAEVFMTPSSKSFEGFMPTLQDLLGRSSLKPDQIHAFIVVKGPGSFTGLRVGLSAAKGFCQGLGIPIIGVSGLEAMVNQMPYTTHPICPIISSRKGEVFAALFQWSDDGKRVRIKEDSCLTLEDLSTFVEGKTLFLGNDISVQGSEIEKFCGENALLAPAHLWNLHASAVGALGLERFKKQDYDELRDLVPSYLRPPDIRQNPFPLLENEGIARALTGDGDLTNHARK